LTLEGPVVHNWNTHQRSQDEIILDILKALSDGPKGKSRIRAIANFSYGSGGYKLFELLLDRNMIEAIPSSKREGGARGRPYGTLYQLTQRGQELLALLSSTHVSLYPPKKDELKGGS
jgi:predicted transcriptional regulator